MAKKKKKTSSSVSKKSSDQNLMLLAAAAAIIVAFFAIFAYKSGNILSLPAASPTPVPVVTLNLDTQNKSGESGTATLQEADGKVTVTLNLVGFPKGVTQPAHIHVGSCPTPGAIKYPLTSVVNGVSVTTLDTTLENLKSMLPLAINVHKSATQSSVYYSCGDLSL